MPFLRSRRLAAVLLLSLACAHEPPQPVRVEAPSGPSPFDDCELGEGDSVPAAYPRGALAGGVARESALACALSAQLEALGEPSLFPLGEGEVLRLLWIRGMGHPVSVRVERAGDRAEVRAAQTSGRGLATPGERVEETTLTLSEAASRALFSRVDGTKFWEPPGADEPDALEDDGSTWVFEGVKGGRYRVHVFHRASIGRAPAFRELGLELIRASGLHVQGAVY